MRKLLILLAGLIFISLTLVFVSFSLEAGIKAKGESSVEEVIPWKEAANYYGEVKTVEGTIISTHRTAKVIFLNFDKDWKSTFTVVIFKSNWYKFPSSPEKFYLSKKVRITGRIKEYRGKPEIIANDPSQIEVVGK